jgi:hypothetical protein
MSIDLYAFIDHPAPLTVVEWQQTLFNNLNVYGFVDNTKADTLVPLGTISRPSPAARPVYVNVASFVAGIGAPIFLIHTCCLLPAGRIEGVQVATFRSNKYEVVDHNRCGSELTVTGKAPQDLVIGNREPL